jgi:hypothetical protein
MANEAAAKANAKAANAPDAEEVPAAGAGC